MHACWPLWLLPFIYYHMKEGLFYGPCRGGGFKPQKSPDQGGDQSCHVEGTINQLNTNIQPIFRKYCFDLRSFPRSSLRLCLSFFLRLFLELFRRSFFRLPRPFLRFCLAFSLRLFLEVRPAILPPFTLSSIFLGPSFDFTFLDFSWIQVLLL